LENELETNTVSCIVAEEMLEKNLGCGDTETYAIGMMVTLMERAAKELADRHIPEGFTTIGVMLNTTHVAPTVLGKEVTAVATLLEISDGQYYFEITASDDRGIIGEATHQRIAVPLEKFHQKAKRRGGVE
jgi:Predicted thioesterase